ncbi:hypothetical protein D3C81_1792420 [compost metagenome]
MFDEVGVAIAAGPGRVGEAPATVAIAGCLQYQACLGRIDDMRQHQAVGAQVQRLQQRGGAVVSDAHQAGHFRGATGQQATIKAGLIEGRVFGIQHHRIEHAVTGDLYHRMTRRLDEGADQ